MDSPDHQEASGESEPSPQPIQGLARRSTAAALDRISLRTGRETKYSRWYKPAQDYYFYSAAETALRATEGRLKILSLSPEERKTLTSSRNLEAITKKASEVRQQHDSELGEASSTMKWLAQFTNGFCDFAVRVSGIVELLLPQSPEYTITYGLLMVMFEAVVDKKEKEESLQEFLASITNQLPLVEFYESVFPTNEMKMTAAAIFAEIIVFLEQATRYYCSGRGRKFIDAIFKSVKYDFDQYMSNIESQTKRMKDLAQVAHVAQTNDMKDLVEDTGVVVARLFKNFESTTSAIGNSVALLSQRLETLQKNQSHITTFHANHYVQSLRQDVYPHVPDADWMLKDLSNRHFNLSEKDHWDNNGVLDTFSLWSDDGRRAVLWIGGDSGNQDNWVTEMSVDLIRALDFQEKTVVFIFCGEGTEPVTPVLLVEQLIVQLLQAYPLLAFQNADRINSRRLKKAETFPQLWNLWQSLMAETGEIFIIIDRVDLCWSGGEVSIVDDVLPSLLKVVQQHEHISMVLTSGTEPPEQLAGDSSKLQSTWVDTAISAHRRYDKRY